MTQTGKCDTCRQRKVKCDQKKPKCGACQKRDRPCLYTYGKLSAFVIEDPTEFSGHGKARVAPLVVPLMSHDKSPNLGSGFILKIEEEGGDVAETPASRAITPISRPSSSARKAQKVKVRSRGSECLMAALSRNSLTMIRPLSAESTLTARFIHMLGPQSQDDNPWLIHGSWVTSVPSRIGCSRAFDLAVEYSIDSFDYYIDRKVALQNTAIATRGKALKALRLALQDAGGPTLDIILAIKMHFHGELFLGSENWINYTLHSVGLSNLLKTGSIEMLDNEDYWSAIDGSYTDDVSEAAFGGRLSKYDNPFYVTITARDSPFTNPANASLYRRVCLAIMHSSIHIPRLVCLVRMARSIPESLDSRTAAISLAEYLWIMDPSDMMDEYMAENTSLLSTPPAEEISNIVPDSLHFRSIESLIVITRYWTLQLYLTSLTQVLYEYFPTECAASLLPDLNVVNQVDMCAGILMAKAVIYTRNVFPKIPLVPLRMLSPIRLGVGPWIRQGHRLTRSMALLDPNSPEYEELAVELFRCKIMQQWFLQQGNEIQVEWHADLVDVETLELALDIGTGGPIPGWFPTWLEDWQAGKVDMAHIQQIIIDEVKRKKGLGGKGWWVSLEEYQSQQPLSGNDWTPRAVDLAYSSASAEE
ncbi:hypothetical protein B0J11DRAFT_581627 [Dendryphion nanum]|uniref:Zn(2)-C6 fungal-type domain-containing protein n=1 Tax=Dendryphion nanum TaxID=256645 RepID=A0A9P9DKH3_9PLEO|nr:hypothetical protein B0J11DRAFT_581627 [Dendryphion nanum]